MRASPSLKDAIEFLTLAVKWGNAGGDARIVLVDDCEEARGGDDGVEFSACRGETLSTARSRISTTFSSVSRSRTKTLYQKSFGNTVLD